MKARWYDERINGVSSEAQSVEALTESCTRYEWYLRQALEIRPLYKNSQDRTRIYHFKKRELIEIGRSSLHACYDDESLDLVMQIGLQEGVIILDRHATI